MNTTTKIINLLAGPCSGKSTTATGIFHQLKLKRVNCELVTEFARDVIYEENKVLLDNQLYIMARQARRQFRLLDKVDYVITDSPLFFNSIYLKIHIDRIPLHERKLSKEYIDSCVDFYDKTFLEFNNVNYFIQRELEYDNRNRPHSEEESRMIDDIILEKLYKMNIPFNHISGTPEVIVDTIVRDILTNQ